MRTAPFTQGGGRRFQRWRAWAVGAGGITAGVLLSTAVPGLGACVLQDSCTLTGVEPGHDWCIDLALGWEWPSGGDPIANGQAIGTVQGCGCVDLVQSEILDNETPQCDFDHHVDVLIAEARAACVAAATPGWVNNCNWTTAQSGVEPPEFENLTNIGLGACPGACGEWSGNCEEELAASCPQPAAGTGGPGCGEEGDGDGDEEADGGLDESGDGTTGGLDAGQYVDCDDNECDVDEDFVNLIYADPMLLLSERARLEWNNTWHRFMFTNVDSGSLGWELGLRSGDLLIKVNDHNITDVDTAWQAAAAYWEAFTCVDLVVYRTTLLEFTFCAV